MSFKEFVKMYYEYTQQDTPKPVPRVVMEEERKYSRHPRGTTVDSRITTLIVSYVVMVIISIVFILGGYWWIALIIDMILTHINISLYRIGIIYYFICWFIYSHFNNSYNTLLKKYFHNKINPAIIYGADNNKYVLDRKGVVSSLVVKFKMHKKGYNNFHNYCKVSFKFNKVVIRKKLKRIVIKNKNYSEENIINKIIETFNNVNFINNN
jgi:hypothetical protein